VVDNLFRTLHTTFTLTWNFLEIDFSCCQACDINNMETVILRWHCAYLSSLKSNRQFLVGSIHALFFITFGLPSLGWIRSMSAPAAAASIDDTQCGLEGAVDDLRRLVCSATVKSDPGSSACYRKQFRPSACGNYRLHSLPQYDSSEITTSYYPKLRRKRPLAGLTFILVALSCLYYRLQIVCDCFFVLISHLF